MSRHTTQAGPGSQFFVRREVVLAPVAAEDLVAWYPFREGTGVDETAGSVQFGDSTDYSATVNGATFQASGGTTDIQTGANSGAFDFDGTDDTLDLGTVADSDQSVTLMAWVKPDVVNTSNQQRVITKADGKNFPDGSFGVSILTDGTVRFFIASFAGSVFVDSSTTISPNQFSHLAGRYEPQNGNATLFINGQPRVTVSAGQAPALPSQPWRIGADNPPDTPNFLDGTVDDTRIYTASLSDSQMNQIYLNTEP